MASTIPAMTLVDMFDRTFSLIGKTIWRNAAIAVSFMVVPVILFTIAANRFYSSLPALGSMGTPENMEAVKTMFTGSFFFGIASLLFALAAMVAEIAITVVVGKELNSERISYGTAVKMAFDGRWLNGIGEGILKMLIIAGFTILAVILGGIVALIVGKGSETTHGVLILFTVLFILVIVAAIFYTILRLYFALTAVAVEDLGPVNALKKSWFLVRGHWWRTLGILILFFILSGFAVSVITVPVMFGTMWNHYKNLFEMLGQTGGNMDMSRLANLQRSLGHAIGISSGLSSILSLLITPAFTVVMYFDLKARQNDLAAPEDTATTEDVPVTTV